jgi:hypothetical protein
MNGKMSNVTLLATPKIGNFILMQQVLLLKFVKKFLLDHIECDCRLQMGTLTREVHVHLGRRGEAFDGNKACNNLLGEKRAEGGGFLLSTQRQHGTNKVKDTRYQ